MPKVESYYTPVMAVKFPKTIIDDKEVNFLYVPDDFPEDGQGQWKFQGVFDPKTKEAQDLLAILDEQHRAIKGANFTPTKKDKEKKDPKDPDCKDLVETGLVAINFTSGYPIKMIDSMKRDVTGVKVGWGSKIRVKFTTKAVNNKGKVGLGRYARVIQILDLKQPGTDLSGFDEVEEGFKSHADAAKADVGWEE